MIPKFNELDFNNAKDTDRLLCECEQCHKLFGAEKRSIKKALSENPNYKNKAKYCSYKCAGGGDSPAILVKCNQCGKEFYRKPSHILKVNNNYCSVKCFGDHKADKIQVNCGYCGKLVDTVKSNIKNSKSGLIFCSIKCSGAYTGEHTHKGKTNAVQLNCGYCNKDIFVKPSALARSKSKKCFCCEKCAGKYNAEHKTHGYSRSKLEIWLESKLINMYPEMEIHFNRRDTINSELDIYIPALKLAFELNGIFHYEPIFGKDKLIYAQNNDKRKFQACLALGIELCTIDQTSMVHFTEAKSQVFLNIISKIIDKKALVT